MIFIFPIFVLLDILSSRINTSSSIPPTAYAYFYLL